MRPGPVIVSAGRDVYQDELSRTYVRAASKSVDGGTKLLLLYESTHQHILLYISAISRYQSFSLFTSALTACLC